MRLLSTVATLLFTAATSALSTAGNRLLVVLDNVAEKSDYSQFFGDLSERGFNIDYETPRSEELSLFHLGEKKYDHLMFLPTKVKALGPNLTPNLLVDFTNAQGNVLVALSATQAASTSLTSFLSELDIVLPDERTGTVVDHFSYDTISANDKHDVLVLDAPLPVRDDIKPYFSLEAGAVLAVPRVSGHALGPGPLLTPILRAPSTAYSYDPKEQSTLIEADELFAAGKQLSLATAFQARNSARVTILGSAEMLTDKWFTSKVTRVGTKGKKEVQNREFAQKLSGWTFQEIGVLRVEEVEHRLKGDNETNPSIYRVKTEVDYAIAISEYVWNDWVPLELTETDALQLEFSMLSPFHRLPLRPMTATRTATIFSTSFILPDQHGIFNFRVNFKRPFMTYIDEKNTVSVRHIAHDEWPRSYAISAAWPWISGIGSVMFGFLAFSAIWVYSKPQETSQGKKMK